MRGGSSLCRLWPCCLDSQKLLPLRPALALAPASITETCQVRIGDAHPSGALAVAVRGHRGERSATVQTAGWPPHTATDELREEGLQDEAPCAQPVSPQDADEPQNEGAGILLLRGKHMSGDSPPGTSLLAVRMCGPVSTQRISAPWSAHTSPLPWPTTSECPLLTGTRATPSEVLYRDSRDQFSLTLWGPAGGAYLQGD